MKGKDSELVVADEVILYMCCKVKHEVSSEAAV